jgi:hypothetical protein
MFGRLVHDSFTSTRASVLGLVDPCILTDGFRGTILVPTVLWTVLGLA